MKMKQNLKSSRFKSLSSDARMYAISDMMHTSLAQYVIVFVVSVIFAVFVGQDAAYTALMTGLAYAIPGTLLVLYLALPKIMTAWYKTGAHAVLYGEFIKIVVVLILLGLIVTNYENLHWPAFITSIIAVANSYFIVLFKRH